jgi:hypothetical protein
MPTLHELLADDYADAVHAAAARLMVAARKWAEQEHAGETARAAVAWGTLVLAAQSTGRVLADWSWLGFALDDVLSLPVALRLAGAAADLHDAAARGDALTDERAAAALDALRRAARAMTTGG